MDDRAHDTRRFLAGRQRVLGRATECRCPPELGQGVEELRLLLVEVLERLDDGR